MRRVLSTYEDVVLTTHVNADGDGTGSQIALFHYLHERGVDVSIVNPTPFPDTFRFLLEGIEAYTPSEEEGRAALERADLIVALDTSEPARLGTLERFAAEKRVAVFDHHPTTSTSLGDPVVSDPAACATGELVYDFLTLDGELPDLPQARGLYVAIVTDTGSFRFGNTSPRAHEVAAALLRCGVDVEAMYRRIYARYTPARLALMQRALSRLEVDPDLPVAWISIRHRDIVETGASAADREGLVEYPRRLENVEVAIFFRELADGRTKVSLRSNGRADVARVARELGGGGHPRAAGILLDLSLEEARDTVLELLRDEVEWTRL